MCRVEIACGNFVVMNEEDNYHDDVPHILAGVIAHNSIATLLDRCSDLLRPEQSKELEFRWKTTLRDMGCLPQPKPEPRPEVSSHHPRLSEDCPPIAIVEMHHGVPSPFLAPNIPTDNTSVAFLDFRVTKKRKANPQACEDPPPLRLVNDVPPLPYIAHPLSGATHPLLGMLVEVSSSDFSRECRGRICSIHVGNPITVRVRGAIPDHDIDALWQSSDPPVASLPQPAVADDEAEEDALLAYLVGDYESLDDYKALTSAIIQDGLDVDTSSSTDACESNEIEEYFSSLVGVPCRAVIHLPPSSDVTTLSPDEDPSVPLPATDNIVVGTSARLRKHIGVWHLLLHNAVMRIDNIERVVRKLKVEIALPASLISR